MGLAGRKQKQRIPADPRNLSWADDASRFGLSYLSKFGWDASQGLGSSGSGMKTHLKVQQKLDLMGIGAQHQRDPNGIAWKQNKDFEALLKRLNEIVEQVKGTHNENKEGEKGRIHDTAIRKAFVRAQQEKAEEKSESESSARAKKRKYEDTDDPDTSEDKRKKRKKEKEKCPKHRSDNSATPVIDSTSESSSTPPSSKRSSESIPKPRPMAHRARIRAAKRIAGKSASAIAEILGIAPSSSTSTPTLTTAPTPPSPSTPATQSSLSLDNSLTTSTKSVADYFKEKLSVHSFSSFSSFSPSSSSAPSGSATPGLGVTDPGYGLSPSDDEDQLRRRGIGSQVPAVPPSQILEASASSAGSDGNLDPLMKRKSEHKAEKRKQLEAKATQATVDGLSAVVKGQVEGDDAQSAKRKFRRMEKRCEQKEQAPAGQSNDNDDDTEKRHKRDNAGSPFPEPRKKKSNVRER